jgi:hypothetical protein
LIGEGRATNADVGECALAYVIAGEIAAQTGDLAKAELQWKRAWELLAPRLSGTNDWRLLDPAARAASWLGRANDAQAAISKLNQFGYVPLDSWPEVNRRDTITTEPGVIQGNFPDRNKHENQ